MAAAVPQVAGELVSASWGEFEASAAELVAAGRELLEPSGDGVALLATVRRDGGPRVHPVMPVATEAGLYVFVVNLSHKYRDLLRDGRYALHSAPRASGEEFYLTGPAALITDAGTRREVVAASGERLGHNEFEVLFELSIDRALHTAWANWGTAEAWPSYRKWSAEDGVR